MPLICYRSYKPTRETQRFIRQANVIINEYQAMDLSMTLRQLFYQFVSRGLFVNTLNNYNRLKTIMSRARLAGLVDWDAIEDPTRDFQSNAHWDSPGQLMRACANQYGIDKWEGQDYQPEVWVEKEALIGVIEGPCEDLDVPFCACRGYSSQSEMWRAGMRLVDYIEEHDRIPVILHFGDHDPSGIHMTEDIENRLCMFVEHHTSRHRIRIQRIALTMAQVEQYSPPPNVAKQTDARYAAYEAAFGSECWELDALAPPVLIELVRNAVLDFRNDEIWDARVEQEVAERGQLQLISRNWRRVNRLLAADLAAERELEEEEGLDLFDDVDDDGDNEEDE